jgi:hypothetical protein
MEIFPWKIGNSDFPQFPFHEILAGNFQWKFYVHIAPTYVHMAVYLCLSMYVEQYSSRYVSFKWPLLAVNSNFQMAEIFQFPPLPISISMEITTTPWNGME